MSLSLAARRARLLAERDQIDAGGGGAVWLFADEPMAASPETAPLGAPTAIVSLGLVSFAMHATEASMSCNAVGNAASSGTITWARFVNGTGTGVRDVAAGPPGSGSALIVSDGQDPPTAVVWSGGELTVTVTVQEP